MADGDDEDTAGTDSGATPAGFQTLDINSSAITRMAYDEATERVLIQFTKGGSYTIEGIKPIEVERWVNSISPGGYFNSFIRGNY